MKPSNAVELMLANRNKGKVKKVTRKPSNAAEFMLAAKGKFPPPMQNNLVRDINIQQAYRMGNYKP